jgi:predicted PurR-regulated permease PerM
MEKGMITNTISAFFSDSTEDKIKKTSISINKYLSRYFIGISIESLCIALLNSLGLIFIVKMDTELSIVIGFASGILNIIPYIGPLIGHILAVTMGLVYHLNGGPTLALPVYLSIILGIFIITQLIDNYLFQPIIYSNSVKAHPLEIFLVILIAGQIGGVVGIIAAIPLYTIIRVILVEFYPEKKFVKRLIGGLDQNRIG